MDEAHGVGKGRYQQMFGTNDSLHVFVEHLRRVVSICLGKDLKPMYVALEV
jgi:hypothetical protein